MFGRVTKELQVLERQDTAPLQDLGQQSLPRMGHLAHCALGHRMSRHLAEEVLGSSHRAPPTGASDTRRPREILLR
jgi:hypothetical protein